jgi:hypothetical protein
MVFFRNVAHVLAALFNNRADFQKRWKAGKEERWQGEWTSEANGHHGPLKCLLTPDDSGDYRAMFYAVYASVLSVAYTVSLHGEKMDGKLKLKGELDLGKLAGGVYRYEGELAAQEFCCNYRCAYDHGTFRLTPLR